MLNMMVFRGVTTHAILKLPMEMVEAFGSTARSQTTKGIRNRRNIYNNIEEGRYSSAYATKLTDSQSKIEAHYLMLSNIGLRMLKSIRRLNILFYLVMLTLQIVMTLALSVQAVVVKVNNGNCVVEWQPKSLFLPMNFIESCRVIDYDWERCEECEEGFKLSEDKRSCSGIPTRFNKINLTEF